MTPITDAELEQVRAAMEKALEAIQYHKDCADEVSWEAVRTTGTEFCKTVSPATLARILARLDEAERTHVEIRKALIETGRQEGLQRAKEIAHYRAKEWATWGSIGSWAYAADQIADAIAKEAEK